jgi:hypothetical protein
MSESYSTNAQLDAVKENVFVVMQARKHLGVSDLTLNSGSVYKNTFSYGRVVGVSNTVNAFALGTSSTLSAGGFYQDPDTQVLYLRKGDSAAPNSSDYIVVTFELYLSTQEALWYSTPTDSTTQVVQFHGVILPGGSPEIKQSQNDTLFGYFPIESSNLVVSNDASLFQNIIYDCSFNGCPINIYHCLGELKTSNFNQKGMCIGGNFTATNTTITFDVLDASKQFDGVVSNGFNYDYWNQNNHTSLDPAAQDRPIRSFYGYNRGVRPVNVTYTATAFSAVDNRDWAIGTLQHGSAGNVDAPATVTFFDNTGTTMSAVNASKFSVSDKVWVDYGSHTDKFSWSVTSITSPTIRYADAGFASAVGDNIRKSYVNKLTLVQNDTSIYEFVYGRDYTHITTGQNTFGIRLTTSAEANVGATTIDPTKDYLLCDVYGKGTLPTMNSVSFGAYEGLGCFQNGVLVLYDFIKSYLGFSESSIDLTSFTNVYSATSTQVGFSIPETANGSFPSYREVIAKLLSTMLLKMYVSNSGKITVSNLGTTKTSTNTILSDDIISDSYKFKVSYDDLCQVNIKCNYMETCLLFTLLSSTDFRVFNDYYLSDSTRGVTTPGSNAYTYLHKGTNVYDGTTYHTNDAQFVTYYSQLKSILGERAARLTLQLKNQVQTTNLNDTYTVTREKLPGFDYTAGTTHTRDFVVTEIEKTISGVNVVLDDQKGIQDDSSEFP